MSSRHESPAEEGDESSVDEEAVDQETTPPGPTYLSKLISELSVQLVTIAETGCQNAGRANQGWFEKRHRDLHSAGLTLLAGATANLAGPAITPGDVLRARYLAHLHLQAVGQIT